MSPCCSMEKTFPVSAVAESLVQEDATCSVGNGFMTLHTLSMTLLHVPSQIHNSTAKSTVDLTNSIRNIDGNPSLVLYLGNLLFHTSLLLLLLLLQPFPIFMSCVMAKRVYLPTGSTHLISWPSIGARRLCLSVTP